MSILWRRLALVGAFACAASGAARAQAAAWQPSVLAVRVTPSEGRLQVGQQLVLAVSATDASGAPLGGFLIAFSTSDPHVATVGDDGTVTAVAPGTATITARVGTGPGARSANAQVRVEGEVRRTVSAARMPSFRSVAMFPAAGRIRVGETLQLAPRAKDMMANDVLDAVFVYTSGDAHIATVSDDGLVTAVAPGRVSVTARVGSGPGARSAAAAIEVLPAQP